MSTRRSKMIRESIVSEREFRCVSEEVAVCGVFLMRRLASR